MYILVRDGQVSNPLFGAQQLLLLPTVTVTSPFPFHCLRSLNHRSPGTAKAPSSPHYLHFWPKRKKKKKKKPNLFLEWGENKTWSPFSEKAHHTANLSWCQDAVSSVDGDVPAIEVPAKTHSLFPAAVKWSLQKSKVDHGGSTSTVPCCILAPDISVPGTMCDTTWTSPGSSITLPN